MSQNSSRFDYLGGKSPVNNMENDEKKKKARAAIKRAMTAPDPLVEFSKPRLILKDKVTANKL